MIRKKLSLVPHLSGCYLMKDINNNIIYVGKSKNLKNRLSSYFNQTHTGKTAKLVSDIVDFEYIITNTEMESLLLEINLIKKYEPKYNIIFRDDKSYPYIEVTNDKIFQINIVRNVSRKKKRTTNIFGPYPNAGAARETVHLINRLYPLRKCKNYQSRECLYYHIGECLGYCHNKIDDSILKNMKNEIISFLNGNMDEIRKKITDKMNMYSETLEFEKALEYKNMLDNIITTLEKQKVELSDNVNRDIIGYYYNNNYLSVVIMFVRGGKLLGRHTKIFSIVDNLENELMNFLVSYYEKNDVDPKEILIPNILNNELLTELFNINFIIPIKGTKNKLLSLANDNARIVYNEKMELTFRNDEKWTNALKELNRLLQLKSSNRIEIFDNSNIFGSFNVSGMVVFIDGKPSKHNYRKFKITNEKNDDYGTMKEVIYRRYFKVLKDNLIWPDLIIVDGGIGQINVTREVLSSLNMSIPVCGLKKDDKHKTSMLLGKDPIVELNVSKQSDLFYLLTRIQDEVHNWTINYHKNIRGKGALSSILDNINGIGEKRKKELLKKYKTIVRMKECSLEELEGILPKNIAKDFFDFLKNYKE